ncbi:MAG TPA: prepilin-type N-terminal cleavage/methylation domain-containing protein [Pontiella sp.]
MQQNKNGFTLVEIVVVVAIIGLLATLTSLKVVQIINRGRSNAAGVDLSNIATATMQLAWDTGRWPNRAVRTTPGSVEVWDLSKGSAGLGSNGGNYPDWKGPYYLGETLDPWGNPYFFDPDYRVNGVNKVVVGSFGANGKGRNYYDEDDVFVVLETMELFVPNLK